jgi:feruloyl esterase
MTLTGKRLVEAFYGSSPRYSYFNGCSSGGRQGLMEAQRFPADYNGILSGAPAINWTRRHAEQMWGQVVMLQAGNFLPQYKFAAAQAAAVAACDAADGVQDGVIDYPRSCTFDPKQLVGASSGNWGAFTEADADVVRRSGKARGAGTARSSGTAFRAEPTFSE